MATLEKIRSKSVLLIVVIGVALLAFIIGDAITNSRNLFGDQTTVAKVGGMKVDYTDYVRKREELNNQLEVARRQNPAQFLNYDSQTLSQMALEQLIGEALVDKAADNAGIQVSPNILSYYVLQQPVNPTINDILQQLNAAGYGVSTPAQAYEIIFNPTRNGVTEAEMTPFRNYWVAMENETAQMIKRNTYQRLLTGTLKANELDKKAIYNDYISTRNVNVAYKPYENFGDEKYTPTDSELKTEYNNIKNDFKVEELTKDVAFIAVEIAPSDADKEASAKLAQQTAQTLRQGEGINKELRKEGIIATHHQMREQDLPRNVKDFVTSAPKDSVEIISENIKGFTVVKNGPKKMEIDSIQLNIVQVLGEGLAAKALASLNSGLSIDSLSNSYPADSIFVQAEQWIALYNTQGQTGAIEPSQLDTLLKSGNKYVSLVSSPQGSLLAKVVNKTNPVAVYEYDEVNYDLKPSTQTVSEARTKLEDFLEANGTSKLFVENAGNDGYTIKKLSLNASTPAVPRMLGMNTYYPDSRQVVRWVLIDGKPGAVSHVYESKDALNPALYAVTVLSEYDDYVPLSNSDLYAAVSNNVKKSKVGEEYMTQYASSTSSMDAASQAMGVESRNNPTFRFGRNSQVIDANVIGKIAGSNPGNVVLVKGDNGIYAYQIMSVDAESFPYNDTQYEQQYFQLVSPDFAQMLKGSKNFKNNIYKFEAGD